MKWKTPLDALAHPVRLRLMRALARHGRGTLAEVAELADVHPNTARAHLSKLVGAGIVEVGVVSESDAPGRPANTYELRAGWEPPASDFRGLAELLASALADARVKPRRLDAAGAAWGRYLSGRPGRAAPADSLPPVLAQLGFDAHVECDRVELVGCPCPLVAPDHPELVCRLARGVVDGVLSATGSGLSVRDALHRPHERVCELQLSTGGRSS